MPIDWNKIRKNEFPVFQDAIHLKSAGGSPMCRSAYQEGAKYLEDIYKFGDIFWDNYFLGIEQARKLIAEYINSKPEEIAFLMNTSSGMQAIARLIEKGEILYPEGEFPTSVHIFKSLGFNNNKILSQTNNVYHLDDIRKQVRKSTKYLIHSHVQFLTGFKQDLFELGRICRQSGVINIINATQSFGAIPLDVKKQHIDMLVASGLKWACSGYGIGILYINEKRIRENRLPFSSWLSVEDKYSMNNENLNIIKKTSSMDGFGGTPGFLPILALKGSLTLIKRIGSGSIQNGIKEIFERIKSLTNKFIELIQELGLKLVTPLDLSNRSGIISIEDDRAEAIYKKLSENKIYISLRNYPKLTKKTVLRFSFNYYNNFEDIEKTIKVLKEF